MSIKYLSPTLMMFRAGEKQKLSKWFWSTEFDDGISEYTIIDSKLLELLDKLRERVGTPVQITSAYRSPEKQKELKNRGYKTASTISTHEVGCAVDLFTGEHTGEELEQIARLVGFKSVGVADNWIHVDIRMDKDRRWTY